MTALTLRALEEAVLRAGVSGLPADAYGRFVTYVEILQKWNTRLNLTALRTPEEILQRHLIECAFAAGQLPRDIETLMDYGSGAGFPGIVIAICRPEIQVTLAESHSRKSSFLREVLRALEIRTNVYEGRVESMPEEKRFHAVSMRAVEKMSQAIPVAARHAERYVAIMSTVSAVNSYQALFANLRWMPNVALPQAQEMVLAIAVPRGTVETT